MAGALQRKVWLDWGLGGDIFPNLFVTLVGPPGKCRKGTAIAIGREMLQNLGIPMAAEAITREALIRCMAECENSFLDPASNTAMYHNSLTVVSAEFGVFIGRESHQLIEDLCDWYDCRTNWEYRTKNQGKDKLAAVYMNMLAATTPKWLQETMPHDAVGHGLTSRMIFVVEEERSKSVSRPFLTPEQRQLKSLLEDDLERIHLLCGEYCITEEAFALYERWYTSGEAPTAIKDERFSGYVERRATHLRKLCMLSSASRNDSRTIEPYDFHRALVLLEATEKHMTSAFGAMGLSKMAPILDQVYRLIRRRKEVRHSVLMKEFWRDADQTAMATILETLIQMQVIERRYDAEIKQYFYRWTGDI